MPPDQPVVSAADSDLSDVRSKRRRYLQMAAISVAMAASLATGFGGFLTQRLVVSEPHRYTDEVTRLVKSDQDNLAELQRLQSRLDEIQSAVGKIATMRPETLRIATLSAELDSVRAQVDKLDDAIGQSPEKALAIPMLKKDVDDLKDDYRRDTDNTQGEINRVYDQNKWFIGLMFTMALGLLGLAVSNFLQLRRP
jgi:hypothetical protein